MKFNLPKMAKLELLWLSCVYFALITILVIASRLTLPESPAILKKSFLSGSNYGFLSFDQAFDVFRPHLPQKGRISFIMDVDFNLYGTDISQIYTAQSNLAPLIINPEPIEEIAIVNCSNDSAAIMRMSMLGYEPIAHVGKGHFVAQKKS